MNQKKSSTKSSREEILDDIIEILANVTMDWDMEFDGPLGSNTGLISDLEFESIDVVQFVVAIEEHYRIRGLPFEEILMLNGRYVDEIRVSEIVEFLYRHLALHGGEFDESNGADRT